MLEGAGAILFLVCYHRFHGGQTRCQERWFVKREEFLREPGSDIWWIRYKIDGVERREKVGRRGDAIKLYKFDRPLAILHGM
jgi:hypothetical protein